MSAECQYCGEDDCVDGDYCGGKPKTTPQPAGGNKPIEGRTTDMIAEQLVPRTRIQFDNDRIRQVFVNDIKSALDTMGAEKDREKDAAIKATMQDCLNQLVEIKDKHTSALAERTTLLAENQAEIKRLKDILSKNNVNY